MRGTKAKEINRIARAAKVKNRPMKKWYNNLPKPMRNGAIEYLWTEVRVRAMKQHAKRAGVKNND